MLTILHTESSEGWGGQEIRSLLESKELIKRGHRAIVLMYHNIGIPPEDAEMRGLYVTPRMFGFQMWYLKVAGFRVVSLKEIVRFIKGESADKKLVAITFDDGYQDFYDNAYPVLRMYNYPSTVFIVSDMAGKENIWDSERLKVRKRLLDWDRILEMKDNGVVFGSHSKTHPSLVRSSAEELEDETRGSKTVIEERSNCPVEFFCYPYGDYDDRVLDAVGQAGYLAAVTTKRGYVYRDDNPLEIRRISIKLTTHPLSFLYKLHFNSKTQDGLKVCIS